MSSASASAPAADAVPAHIPASPGPYTSADQAGAAGPAAVIQLSHGHFLITMSVVTTFLPSAVLPTIYALLPQAQLQADHIDLQIDEAAHKLRVQIVGVTPANNPNAVSNLAARLKTLQPGATVVVRDRLSQLSVDSDSISAVSSLLMSSQSRALLDQHIHYYRLHSHPSFMAQLLIYIETKRTEHVINIMRNFMADPVAGGMVRPPRPSGLEVKGDEIPAAAAAAAPAPAVTAAIGAGAGLPPTTPEKAAASASGVPVHRGVQSSSRSPHFKAKTIGLPPAAPLDAALSATSSTALALQQQAMSNQSTSTVAAPTAAASSASSSSASASSAAAAPASDPHHAAAAPAPTSVSGTTPIRIDNKWWSSKRVELLRLLTAHSMNHDALYVYSLSALRANIAALKSIGSIDRIFFACKANHNPEVLRTIESAGLGFECVSIHELKFICGLFPGLSRERLLFTPNFAGKFEYEQAYWYTDNVNIDNLYAIEQWGEMFRGKTVMLRMDPGEGLGYHDKMRTGGARSKFGISVSQLQAALPKITALGIKVTGLHVHKGSGIHDSSVWARTAEFLASLRADFPHLRVLDLGGGLGVSYKDTDEPLDLSALDRDISGFKSTLDKQAGSKLELWLEPGRFVVATAGVLLATVTQLKSKPGRSFVGLSTGMNSLIRPALYESHHDIINLSRLPACEQPAAEAGKVYLNSLDPRTHSLVDVVGPICETGDILGSNRSLPQSTAEGDVILIDTVGAYGRVMSSTYNMREPGLEVTIE